MKYTVRRLRRLGEFRWCVLKDGEYAASIATYGQAVNIARCLNGADQIEHPEDIKGESYRPHAKRAVEARKFA
jgi:hypothetical protein